MKEPGDDVRRPADCCRAESGIVEILYPQPEPWRWIPLFLGIGIGLMLAYWLWRGHADTRF